MGLGLKEISRQALSVAVIAGALTGCSVIKSNDESESNAKPDTTPSTEPYKPDANEEKIIYYLLIGTEDTPPVTEDLAIGEETKLKDWYYVTPHIGEAEMFNVAAGLSHATFGGNGECRIDTGGTLTDRGEATLTFTDGKKKEYEVFEYDKPKNASEDSCESDTIFLAP